MAYKFLICETHSPVFNTILPVFDIYLLMFNIMLLGIVCSENVIWEIKTCCNHKKKKVKF